LTTDHEQIKQWAEARGGKAAAVAGTGTDGDNIGILRIEFPEYSGDEELERIQWPSFFKRLDERGLALLYQEQTRHGETSRFNKLVYAPQGVLTTLHEEHEKVRSTLEKMSDTTSNAVTTRPRLLEQLRELLVPHMDGEEKVVYKGIKKAVESEDNLVTVLEGYEEHKLTRRALKHLSKAEPDSAEWTARLSVIKELVEHHIEEEESEMFDVARNAMGQEGLETLAAEYTARRDKSLKKLKN
jgi:hemerythrin-like domain-containing protein